METVCEPEVKKSTHRAEVVPVVLEPHGNADSLSVVNIWGYQCVVRTEDWRGISKAIYCVPDSVVDVRRPEFAFLAEQAKGDGTARIKAKRLRGVTSYGLLVPAPEGAELGEDWAERLGITRYEPPEPGDGPREKFFVGGENEAGPDLDTGPNKYDVEAFERYHDVLTPGEPLFIQEKLDGSNCRAVFWEGRFWVKSRNNWVKRTPDYSHVTLPSLLEKGVPEDKANEIVERLKAKKPQTNGFWQVLEATPNLFQYLEANPGTVVYGEVFGSTNRIRYGLPEGNAFAAFDIFQQGRFLGAQEFIAELDRACVARVPALAVGEEYSFDSIKKLAEGKTVIGRAKKGTIREGVVVRPMAERWDKRVGRVVLKCVSPDFLGMKERG